MLDNDDFHINIGNPIANVYSQQPKEDFITYFVKVEFPQAGIYINGLKVILYDAESGQYKVYCPSLPNPDYKKDKSKGKFIMPCEFDKDTLLWQIIENSCLNAVEYCEGVLIKRHERENNHDDELPIYVGV